MNITVVYAHPYNGSFNQAILERAQKTLEKNHKVTVIDLNKDNFNPVLTEKELAVYAEGKYLDPLVEKYQKIIVESDHLFFIHPVWWALMPAILKGFIDKVFLKGFAYELTETLPKGTLVYIKGATLITTMSSPSIYYDVFVKKPLKGGLIIGTLKFCGIKKVKWIKIGMVNKLTPEKGQDWLKKIEAYCQKL